MALAGICALFLMAWKAPAMADDGTGFYAGKEEGWYFYKDRKPLAKPKEAELPKPTAAPAAVAPAPAPVPAPVPAPPPAPVVRKAEPFSVPWMKEKLEILRNNAIQNPTDENAAAYMYAQRLLLDMSENFATAGSKAAESDPFLNEAVRFPIATAARRAALWQVDKAKDLIVKDLAGKTALWFFFDSSCVHCHSQYPTMKLLEKNFGFPVKYISQDSKPLTGMGPKEYVIDHGRRTFQQLGLKLTPAVVLVAPPGKMMIVAHGAMALSDLQSKIVQAALDKDLVPKELSDVVHLESKGILAAADVAKMKETMKDTDDPQELVKMMQIAIGRRMN